MSHPVNLVRVLTSATGNSTPITLGAAYSQLFMTMAEAGAIDGRPYTYLIVDGNNWELGRGVYTASGTSLARTTILASRSSGTLGTSRITLSGTAQVRVVDAAEDKGGVRGTRPVTGTTDVIMNSDQAYVVTYSNASAIAASLAQAGASGAFLDGWVTWIRNKGAGTLTITPATSTINGATTLVLATNQGAFIWSDGTNYQAFVFGVVIGQSAGTVAAGNDSRITGSAQLSQANAFTDATEASGVGTTASAIFTGGVEVLKKLFVNGAALFRGAVNIGIGSTGTNSSVLNLNGGSGTAAGSALVFQKNSVSSFALGHRSLIEATGTANLIELYNYAIPGAAWGVDATTNRMSVPSGFDSTVLVQVAGGGGDGLRLRLGPTGNAMTITLGSDDNMYIQSNGTSVARISPSTGVYTSLSDVRLKSEVRAIQPAEVMTKLRALGGAHYFVLNGEQCIGVVLDDDTSRAFAELVNVDPDGIRSFNYAGLTAPLASVAISHDDRIEALETRLAALGAVRK